MRALWISLCIATLVVVNTAQARDRHKKSSQPKEPAAEEQPAEEKAEPAADSGWDTSAASTAAAAPASDTEGDHASQNVAAIDAAADASAEDQHKADQVPPTWWFGAYLHGAFVPSFMLGLFLDGPPTIANATFGVTATHRTKDGFSLVLGLGYASYAFAGPFHQTGKPDEDTEWVKSTLGLVHVTGEMLWSTNIVATASAPEMLSFEYGIGLDFGIVTGHMTRTEAYPTGHGYAPCVKYLNPNPTYCEVPQAVLNGTNPSAKSDAYNQTGAQYGAVEKRIPPIAALPMLPILALRLSPARNLAIKLEGAYGIFQFWFGLSAAYGVDI